MLRVGILSPVVCIEGSLYLYAHFSGVFIYQQRGCPFCLVYLCRFPTTLESGQAATDTPLFFCSSLNFHSKPVRLRVFGGHNLLMTMKKGLSIIFSGMVLATILSCTDDKQKEIVCWGDSLTAPHGTRQRIKGNVEYPKCLEGMLSDEYKVINAGVGGETTLTIMARQGAYPMMLAHDVTIFNGDESKYDTFIGNRDVDAFVSSYNGKQVTPLLQCGWDEDSPAHINPCRIDGKQFWLSSEAHFWLEEGKYQFEYNYYIKPQNEIETTDTLKAGSIINTYAMEHLRGKYANVFFIGQNGGFEDVADLIKQLQAMIKYSQCDRYIIISFHKPNNVIQTISRMREMEDSLQQCFGEHYINLRQHLVTQGLSMAGLQATQEDKDSIAKGQVPPQLLSDGVHFTKAGYRDIAELVYSKMKELHY